MDPSGRHYQTNVAGWCNTVLTPWCIYGTDRMLLQWSVKDAQNEKQDINVIL